MKYYVVDTATGCMDEIPAHDTIESAVAERDALNAEAMQEGHADGFTHIIDEDGYSVDDNGKRVDA